MNAKFSHHASVFCVHLVALGALCAGLGPGSGTHVSAGLGVHTQHVVNNRFQLINRYLLSATTRTTPQQKVRISTVGNYR